MVLHERCLWRGGLLEIELHADLRYRLRYAGLVEYLPGRKVVRGRAYPYAFRSIEQLRYDFEQDAKAAGGALG
jgi:hypothetical protein